MANEINFNLDGTLQNGEIKDRMDTGRISASQSSPKVFADVQTIATTDTVITFGSLVSRGYTRLRNLDPTNYIDIGPDAGGSTIEPTLRLLPLGPELLVYFKPGVVIIGKANAGPCKLSIKSWDA